MLLNQKKPLLFTNLSNKICWSIIGNQHSFLLGLSSGPILIWFPYQFLHTWWASGCTRTDCALNAGPEDVQVFCQPSDTNGPITHDVRTRECPSPPKKKKPWLWGGRQWHHSGTSCDHLAQLQEPAHVLAPNNHHLRQSMKPLCGEP